MSRSNQLSNTYRDDSDNYNFDMWLNSHDITRRICDVKGVFCGQMLEKLTLHNKYREHMDKCHEHA